MIRYKLSNAKVTRSFFKAAGLGTSSVESLKKQELVAGR